MTEPTTPHSVGEPRRRRRFAPVVWGLLLVAVLLATAVQTRRPLIEWALLHLLDANQARNVSLQVEAVDPTRLILSHLSLSYEPTAQIEVDVTLGRAEFTFTPQTLLEGRVEHVDLSGLKLKANVASQAARPTPASNGDPLTASLTSWTETVGSLPARSLSMRSAQADLDFPEGRLAAEFELEMNPVSDGAASGADAVVKLHVGVKPEDLTVPGIRLRAPVELSLEAMRLDVAWLAELKPVKLDADFGEEAPTRVVLQTPELRGRFDLQSDAQQPLTLSSGMGALELPSMGISARGISLAAGIEPTAWVSVKIEKLRDERSSPRFAPLTVRARISPIADRLDFEVDVADESGHLNLLTRGSHDPATGRGHATSRLGALRFGAEALQPSQLAPALEGTVSDLRGEVQALASTTWDLSRAEPMTAHLEVAIGDLDLSTPWVRLEGIHGVIELTGPSPWSTPPGQQIAIGVVDLGIAATDALVVFGLRPDGVLVVGDARLRFAGGTLQSASRIELDGDVHDVVLEVSGIELGQLLSLVDMEGLTGSGTLSGRIPLHVEAETVEVRDGHLSNEGSGSIRYLPARGGEIAASAYSQLDTAIGVLTNLQFDRLDLSLSGQTKGLMHCVIRVEGQNPDFENGWPIKFKLDLESRLVDLVREVSSAAEIAHTIQERISDFSTRAANFAPPPPSNSDDTVVAPEPGGD
ncbi:YdbH domain-containing protein [Myxococcota bacterium]|nr:YdbH domain-containing protein [Myxococcota bacterium]